MSELHPETAAEQTAQIDDLIIAVRHAEAKADRAEAAARKPTHRARKPMASTEAYVAVTVAVCVLLAFVAYLYFTY